MFYIMEELAQLQVFAICNIYGYNEYLDEDLHGPYCQSSTERGGGVKLTTRAQTHVGVLDGNRHF